MNTSARRYLSGHFRRHELGRYLIGMSGIFSGVIALCWMGYPVEKKWWIASHYFSSLGSFSHKRNPTWWWLFSIAMIFWSMALVPLVLYLYRRYATITRIGAAVGAFWLFWGCAGLALIAIFPDAPTPLVGNIRWNHVHITAGIITSVGFNLGFVWHGLLLAYDSCSSRSTGLFRHRKFAGPYLLWAGMIGTAAYFRITWHGVYHEMKAAAVASSRHIGSSWAESLNTCYSLPLWENLLTYMWFIIVVWMVLLVPHDFENAVSRSRK
jgi:hypothetical protein